MSKLRSNGRDVEKTIERLRERRYRSQQLTMRFGDMGTPQRLVPGISVMNGIPQVRTLLESVSPLDDLPPELQLPYGHEALDRDTVLTAYAQTAALIIGTGVIISLADELLSLSRSEAEHAAAQLVLGERNEEFMAKVAAFTGIMSFEDTTGELRLDRVADVIRQMQAVEIGTGKEGETPKVSRIDMTPDNWGRLRDEGFDFNHAAIHSVAASEENTPVVVHWGPTHLEQDLWDASEMAGTFRERALTITVAHRQHGYLALLLTIGLDEDYEPTVTLCHAVAETVEEHNDPDRLLLAIDPFQTRQGDAKGDAYQVVEGDPRPQQNEGSGAAAMLRALADVLEGKSNRIEWDEKFDNDDEDISPHSMGRKAKA